MHGLRCKTDVPDDGNLGTRDAFDDFGALASAFQLDRFGPGFLDEAQGVAYGVVDAGVIAAVGHVGDEQGAACAAADGAGVVEHLVHCDRERVGVAEHGHGEGIADQREVDTGFVDESCGGIIDSGEGGDACPAALAFSEGVHGAFGTCGGWLRAGSGKAHVGLECRSVVGDAACLSAVDCTLDGTALPSASDRQR